MAQKGFIRVGFVEKIEPAQLLSDFLGSLGTEAGAVTIFTGRIKGNIEGKKVNSLVYEAAEPYSTQSLEKIAREELEKNGLLGIMIYHKKGEAFPGEPVLFIAVASVSRKEAVNGLYTVLERVKHEAYVWKLEKREDGDYWIIGDSKRVPKKER